MVGTMSRRRRTELGQGLDGVQWQCVFVGSNGLTVQWVVFMSCFYFWGYGLKHVETLAGWRWQGLSYCIQSFWKTLFGVLLRVQWALHEDMEKSQDLLLTSFFGWVEILMSSFGEDFVVNASHQETSSKKESHRTSKTTDTPCWLWMDFTMSL